MVIKAVIEHERERCAQIAENHRPRRYRGGDMNGRIYGDPMRDIAAKIREGETE